MKSRLLNYPLVIVVICVLHGLPGWFNESSSMKWIAPAFGLALIAVALGINSLIMVLNTEKRQLN